MTDNGHANGTTALLSPDDQKRWRGDLALIRQAVKSRWNVPDEMKKQIVGRIGDVLALPEGEITPRTLVSLGKTLASFDSNDLKALELLDKIHRLDTGGATENIQQAVTVRIVRDDG